MRLKIQLFFSLKNYISKNRTNVYQDLNYLLKNKQISIILARKSWIYPKLANRKHAHISS